MIRLIVIISGVALLTACGSGHDNTGPSPQNTVPAESAPSVPHVQTPPPAQRTGIVRYAFADRFNEGRINSKAVTSTPTGKGALVLEWPFGPQKAKSLTLIATYNYSYRAVLIRANDVLSFEATKPLAVGGVTKAVVDITDGAKTSRIFDQELPAATSQGLDWKPFAIDLKQFAGHRVDVTFGCETVRGDGVGAWVAFARPAIISSAK